MSSSKKLSDLSEADSKSVCHDLADDFPTRTVTCDGQSLTLGFDSADCDMGLDPVDSTCTATVGDAHACYEAIFDLTDAEICDTNTPEPAACMALDEC